MGWRSQDPADLEPGEAKIDLLELMYWRKPGDRTPEEDRLLEQLLFETRFDMSKVQKNLARRKNRKETKICLDELRLLDTGIDSLFGCVGHHARGQRTGGNPNLLWI